MVNAAASIHVDRFSSYSYQLILASDEINANGLCFYDASQFLFNDIWSSDNSMLTLNADSSSEILDYSTSLSANLKKLDFIEARASRLQVWRFKE